MTMEPGDVFTAEVSYITRRGTGAVSKGHDTITIGPVDCEKGTLVQLKYLGDDDGDPIAICLTEDAVGADYQEHVRNYIDHMIPDAPPDIGEETYIEIDEVDEQGLGVTILGGERIQLGPVAASPGDIVKIKGETEHSARVCTESAKGEHYETRFNILTEQYDALPVSPGDEFETFITGADDGVLIGYVDDTPIHFPDGGAEVGQKVAGEVVGFADDRIIADITEAYDEVGRTQNSSHWARMKWLGQADTAFQNEALRTVVAHFTGAASENLPTDADRLQQILVAEAIRLALQDKATDSDETYPRAHITGLRHWVIQKLSPLLGEPTTDEDEEGDDWFRNVLTDGPGPTLTFLGDILSLSNGYYAPGPTRAIKRGAETAVLVSGRPSQWFVKNGYELKFRGVSRVIDGTPLDTVADAGIPIQSLEEYLGTEDFGTSWLEDFIDARDTQEWTPESEWQPYVGHRGYGFEWGDDALRVDLDGTRIVSLWKVPVEYGADEYQLKIDTSDEATAKMVTVPLQYYKQVAIMLDAIAGVPRRVKLSGHEEKIRLSCNFSPPRAQMRWLTAIGARWIGPEGGHIHWRIDRSDISSVEEAFEQVAVKLDTAVTPHSTQ